MKNDLITCEVCGKQKAKSEMSKSYKHRCKECVAAYARQARADEAKQDAERAVKKIDWEQRRYEVAKNAMVGLMAGHHTIYEANKLATVAMQYADALINELKKGENNENHL